MLSAAVVIGTLRFMLPTQLQNGFKHFSEEIYFCNMYTDFMFKKFAKMIQITVILQQY